MRPVPQRGTGGARGGNISREKMLSPEHIYVHSSTIQGKRAIAPIVRVIAVFLLPGCFFINLSTFGLRTYGYS